ncbi:MAG: carboxylesterase family protein [Chromatiales bacterium]|nr:MAG: carboxylesterase family protein [Chromatiales bacterium]
MRTRIGVCTVVAIGSLLAMTAALGGGHTPPELVRIDTGELQGTVADGVAVFRGIPYAAPPVGELRWRPPQPPAAWDGVRDASKFGHACPQKLGAYPEWADTHFESVGLNEDCLTLNVWTPVRRSGPLPVMFYIHGGNMQYGASSMPIYDGGVLARQGVVLVTINYRIGYLGRFAHPAMTRAQAGEPLANYGVFDQIAALEWVQRNIAEFGGDPNRVTIFGHSAGGVSVNVLMVTPQSKGLFQGAIAQGSGILLDMTQHAFERGRPGPTAKSREDMGVDFVEYFEIDADSDEALLAELRAMPWEPMVEYQRERQVPFNPVVDEVVVVDHVARVFERGEQHDVPYIGGANSWEWNQIADVPLIGKWFLGGALIEGLSDEDLAAFDDQWTRIGKSQRWFSEGLFLSSTRYLGKQMANVDSPAWLYHITYINERLRGEIPGAVHGLEVPFIFGNVREHPEYQRPVEAAEQAPTEADLVFGDTLQAYWLKFAKTGNPNGEGLPVWPEYRPDTDLVLVADAEMMPQASLYKDTLDYLEERALIRRREFENARAEN